MRRFAVQTLSGIPFRPLGWLFVKTPVVASPVLAAAFLERWDRDACALWGHHR